MNELQKIAKEKLDKTVITRREIFRLICQYLVKKGENYDLLNENLEYIITNFAISLSAIEPSFFISNFEEDWISLRVGCNHRLYYLHWTKNEGKNFYEFTTDDGNLSVGSFDDKMDIFPVLVLRLTQLMDSYKKCLKLANENQL